MNGVTIGNIHCYKNWKLFLSSTDIGEPELETITIPVPGRAGVLDCTEKIFGGPVYKNRTITLQFQAASAAIGESREAIRSKVGNAWHGQKKKIVFDSDPLYYYEGRVKVDSVQEDSGIITVSISCDCKPYKYLISDPTQKSL